MAIGAGKIGIRRVDMHEIMTLSVDLIERFTAALGEDQMA